MSEAKAPKCLNSMPRELLDKIYGHLFDLEDARVTKIDVKCPWSPREQFIYVLFTALLRVNRVIGQGAQMVLYNKNLLVLFSLMDTRGDIETAFRDRSQYFPIIFVPDECSLPPCSVIVHHRRYKAKKADRPRSLAIVIRAFDFPKLCNNFNRYLQHCEVETESYTLMALPEAGWPREQLRSLIWEPLRDLRHAIFQSCVHSKMSPLYYKIKVVDGTGTFEPTSNPLVWRAESQHEDSRSDDVGAYSRHDGGYERDRECATCGGCGIDYDSKNADWKSEGSYSEPDLNSDARSEGQFRKYKSLTETGETGTLAYKEQNYLGDDELTDDDSSELRKGRKKLMRMRLRKRWTRISRYDHSQGRWINIAAEKRDRDILAKRD